MIKKIRITAGFKAFIFISFIIFNFNCSSSIVDTKIKKEPSYEERLYSYLKSEKDVDVGDTVLFLTYPIYLQCKQEGLKMLKNSFAITILHSRSDECPKVFNSQKCIEYNSKKIGEIGLNKPYSQLFLVKSNSVELITNYF